MTDRHLKVVEDEEPEVLTVTSANGVTWNILCKPMFDYGLCIVFHDAHNPEKFPPHGQLVAYYGVDTIISITGGLNLAGGVPNWWIDAATMSEVSNWALHQRGVDIMRDNEDQEDSDG